MNNDNVEGPRAAWADEIDEAIDIANLVFRKDKDPNIGRLYPLIFSREHPEAVRIITVDGHIVSMMGTVIREMSIFGSLLKVVSIGAVCTHPDHRGKGYATRVLLDSFEMFDEERIDLVLISGGRGLYRRVGCTDVGRFFTFVVSADFTGSKDTDSVSISAVTRESLYDVQRIYESEPVRYLRQMDDLIALWQSGGVMNNDGDILLIRTPTEALAYVAVQRNVVKPENGKTYLNIPEYGGCRQTLLTSVGALSSRYSAESVRFTVSWHDRALIEALRAAGLQGEATNLAGTVKIISASRLTEKLRPRIEELAGRKVAARLSVEDLPGNSARIVLGTDVLELETPEDVAKFFLSFPDENISNNPVRRALTAVLPLPLPWPGLNFQ